MLVIHRVHNYVRGDLDKVKRFEFYAHFSCLPRRYIFPRKLIYECRVVLTLHAICGSKLPRFHVLDSCRFQHGMTVHSDNIHRLSLLVNNE
jgi:hypothetical protein